jgi:hypothetical protein
MLTNEAYREREWAWLPTLRAVLEGRPKPFDGRFSSTDDSETEALARVLSAATLAEHYKNEIRKAARQANPSTFHDDIDRLESALRGAARHFTGLADKIRQLHSYLEGAGTAGQGEAPEHDT